MMSQASYDFLAAYQRVLEVIGTRSQLSLANALGVSQASVWEARQRAKTIPAGWLVVLVDKYGINPEWIRTGEGPQYLRILENVPLEELCHEIMRRHDAWRRRYHNAFGRAMIGQNPLPEVCHE